MADHSKITCCLVSIIRVSLVVTFAAELTNGFVPCTKNNPKLGECLKTSLQNNIPNLVNGIPSVGWLPLDPFHVKSLEIDQGTGPVNIKLNIRDLDVSNIGSAKINAITANVENNNFTLDVEFEKPITLDGNFDIKGKVMILPITGNGKVKISLDNVRAKIIASMKTVVKNEDTYMEIQDMSLKFTTTKVHIMLDNLFNGDKVLGNIMNEFLNENWKDILGELQSNIENSIVTIISNVIKPVLIRLPLSQIIKD